MRTSFVCNYRMDVEMRQEIVNALRSDGSGSGPAAAIATPST
ncbi:hypothetical protein [Streptomyces sp. NPDC024089]